MANYSIEDVRGKCRAPRCKRWCEVNFKFRPLYLLYLLDRRLDRSHILSRHSSGEKNKTGNVRINVIFRRVHITVLAVEKLLVLHITECMFVALAIQHAKRMRSITLPTVASLSLTYFSTLSQKRHNFRKSY